MAGRSRLFRSLVRTVVLAVLACFSSLAQVTAQSPEVVVELERDQIYEGETVEYRVFVNHVDQEVSPQLTDWADFGVQFKGTQAINSSQISIINGRREEMTRRGLLYAYTLTPKRSGKLTVPAPRVEVNGKELPSRSLTLTVVAAAEQDVALLEMTVDRDEVYPLQPFELKLTIWIKPVPEPLESRDPLTVQNPLVQLSLPWADDDQLASAVQPKIPAERWLAPYRLRRGGFAINGRTSRRSLLGGGGFGGAFGSLLDDGSQGYSPVAQRAFRPDAKGRRVEYWEYQFTRTLVANQVDDYAFGPVSLKGVFGTRANTRGELEGEPVYAFAKPLTVRVKDVPLVGRPDSYSGAVGRFEIGADLSPLEAKVGDPLTLTLWLKGEGTLDNALAPKLDRVAELTDRFKVYDATEETRGDVRLFTYSVRPRDTSVTELPAIPLSYFDVDAEKYVTLQTVPIAIKVTEADRLRDAEIATATPSPHAETTVESHVEGIFANVTDTGQIRDETVRPERWFAGLGSLAGLFLIVTLVKQRGERWRSDPQRQRRRGAVTEAKQRLQEARRELNGGQIRTGIEQLSSALIGLLAAASDRPDGSLTSADAISTASELGCGASLVARLRDVLQACDDARYGASSGSLAELTQKAARVLDELVRELRQQRRLS